MPHERVLTVGSLFSGIGGIDLGLERAGMVTRWFCEIDPHCRNVLARHWPGLPIYGDITAVDWSGIERVDVLAGGFPCQPVSLSGRGLAQDDERWLWPEFERAIRALRPRYVFVENVAALLGRGFGEVITDLAALGYDAEWASLQAAEFGAPHERDRLFLVAYPHEVYGSAGMGIVAVGAEPIFAGRNRPRLRFWLPPTPEFARMDDGVPSWIRKVGSGLLGNAVVPQVVEWIGHRIVAFDEGRVDAA